MENMAGRLSSTIGPLRRRLLRMTRQAAGLPVIPDASIELMRVVDQLETPTVAEVAAALNTATSTVSNLLRTLQRDELIIRAPDEADRRVSRLALTDRARGLLERYDGVSEQLVAEAVSRMDAANRANLEPATEALQALLHALEEVERTPLDAQPPE